MNIVVEEGAPVAQQVTWPPVLHILQKLYFCVKFQQFGGSNNYLCSLSYIGVFQAFYHFEMQSNEVAMQIARRYCKNCTFLDPIAVSMLQINVLIIEIMNDSMPPSTWLLLTSKFKCAEHCALSRL
jgi:hypothetical protein